MVFGLFNRKPDPKPSQSPATQLRTPSPSVISSSSPRVDAHGPPITPSPPPELATDPIALRNLIQSIPPKTLHLYTLSHLATAPPQLFTHLSQFFSALEVPPTLHCVRCHKGYFEVENSDRSCLVAHDDDSAEVERVGAGYETLWGCCGKTVEGNGDSGPPDGWCYEGLHTTDLKRARFRADSTIQHDKLAPCSRLRCHDPPGSRKRTRRTATGADADSDTDSESDDDGASHSSIRTRSHASKRARITRATEAMSDTDRDDDVEMPRAGPSSVHASPKSTASACKPRAKSGVTRSVPAKAKAAKSRSTHSSSNPPSPARSKKPPSTRFAPGVSAAASFTSTSSSAVCVDGSATTQTQTQTQTVNVVSSAAKIPVKRAMKPKQPKQPKRLDEVVQSSVAGEMA
ncbi:hypothetical protein GGX14DRAFT_628910 [Mycena pura]|uniref:Uncharacterized protein n=1 Tax=Mycena pura TaxID=153505 RepID=A0AAD7E4P7_9AGAR|nr:hypothetical protein GGX14DRAFT_628910 [Mycena pura]